ncbi:MAG: hypothetical protein ACR2N6_08715 [Miltoncostaeaceae bacterium]
MPPAEPVKVPDAPLGRADATRRWGLRMGDGSVAFAGLARPEAQSLVDVLRAESTQEPDGLAVVVELPVVLSDGAGPHLLCADGSLALALGAHPHMPELLVAMGEPRPEHRIGLVGPLASEVWRWHIAALVDPADRVAALDRLTEAADDTGLDAWSSRFAAGQ